MRSVFLGKRRGDEKSRSMETRGLMSKSTGFYRRSRRQILKIHFNSVLLFLITAFHLKLIHFNTSRQPRLRKFHKSFNSFHVQLDVMGKRSFPSIFNGAGDPFVNDCRKFTMQTEKYIDGGRWGACRA